MISACRTPIFFRLLRFIYWFWLRHSAAVELPRKRFLEANYILFVAANSLCGASIRSPLREEYIWDQNELKSV